MSPRGKETKQLNLVVDPQLSERIEEYWKRKRFISKAEAIRQLLLIALEIEDKR